MWQKALGTAACLLLCAALALGAVMMASPTARAWVVERVVRWTDSFTEFIFTSDGARGLSADWRPAYVPNGFAEIETDWDEEISQLNIVYENQTGLRITLMTFPSEQSGSFIVDNEHSDYQEIDINGHPASMFVSNTDGYPNYLIWTNSDGTIMHCLMSRLTLDELIAIAKSGP